MKTTLGEQVWTSQSLSSAGFSCSLPHSPVVNRSAAVCSATRTASGPHGGWIVQDVIQRKLVSFTFWDKSHREKLEETEWVVLTKHFHCSEGASLLLLVKEGNCILNTWWLFIVPFFF